MRLGHESPMYAGGLEDADDFPQLADINPMYLVYLLSQGRVGFIPVRHGHHLESPAAGGLSA